MNRYGQQAMKHWHDTRPGQMRDLADPEAFFTQMGEDLAQAVEELARKLAGSPPPNETFMGHVQRLTMARFEAEGQVLRGMLLTTG